MFNLHPKLAEDCFQLGNFPLSRLLLMNDSHYPWFILVPRVPEITEIYQLSQTDQQQLTLESSALCEALVRSFHGDKMNIAALGNIVSQLHVHHVVRYKTDQAWPAPVWGKMPALPYRDGEVEKIIARLSASSNSVASSSLSSAFSINFTLE